jgi:hypothetical protein
VCQRRTVSASGARTPKMTANVRLKHIVQMGSSASFCSASPLSYSIKVLVNDALNKSRPRLFVADVINKGSHASGGHIVNHDVTPNAKASNLTKLPTESAKRKSKARRADSAQSASDANLFAWRIQFLLFGPSLRIASPLFAIWIVVYPIRFHSLAIFGKLQDTIIMH